MFSRPGLGTDLCALAVRLFLQSGSHCRPRKTNAVLFVDLAKAFHRTIRQIAYGIDSSDESVAKVMQGLDIPRSAMTELMHILEQPAPTLEAGLTMHQTKLIQEFHAVTWCTMDHANLTF